MSDTTKAQLTKAANAIRDGLEDRRMGMDDIEESIKVEMCESLAEAALKAMRSDSPCEDCKDFTGAAVYCDNCGRVVDWYPNQHTTQVHLTPLSRSKEERTKLAKEFFDQHWSFTGISKQGSDRRNAVIAFIEWYFGPKEGTG